MADEDDLRFYEELHRRIAEGPDRKTLDRAVRENLAAQVPLAPPALVCLLSTLACATSPRRILEVGTGHGYSASLLALASPGSELTTIEVDGPSCDAAARLFDALGITNRVRLVHDDAARWLLEAEGQVDFAFLDADKEQYPTYLQLVVPRLPPGAMLIADDVYFTGDTPRGPLPESQKMLCMQAMATFRGRLREDPRFLTSFLSIGCGISVSVVLKVLEPRHE